MSGNIKLKLKINRGIAIAALSSVCLFAMADYVSIVNSNEVSYIAEKPEPETMTVGSIVLRIDNVNPETLYSGKWELVTGDASIRLGNGTDQNLSIQGNGNTQNISLTKHNHNASQSSHNHNRGNMEIYGIITAPYYPEVSVGYSLNGTGAFAPYGGLTVIDDIDGNANQGSVYRSVDFRSSRNWTGNTNSVAPSITINETGVDNTNINIRGKYLRVNVWKKIS